MNMSRWKVVFMRRLVGRMVAGFLAAGAMAGAVFAQDAQDAEQQPQQPPTFSQDQLNQLVSPIALYPDPLVAQITAAATFPNEIVMADRDVNAGMSANDLAQQPDLDASVQALGHYPALLKWMDDNLQWTTQLGQAFTSQEGDVMDAVQQMRARAQSLGNLPSTPQETVTDDDGDIEIEPADPDEIYVPAYNPDVIYYDPGVFCTFGFGLPVGIWWNADWDWHHHEAILWGPGHLRPHDWWTRPPSGRHDYPAGRVWHPPGGRVFVGGNRGDRGYGAAASPRVTPHTAPFHPGNAAPRDVRTVRPQPERRQIVTPQERAPEIAPRQNSSGGMFGGESSRSAEAFSSRGAESRGVSTPSGGGGGGFHGGGGGGGGGGGSHGGGGGGSRGH